MTSKEQQNQNNSSVDNDSQVERLSKHHYKNPAPGLPRAPSAQESPKGAKRKSKKAEGSSLSTAKSGTNSKSDWVAKQQKLWKEQYGYEAKKDGATPSEKPDEIWYKH
jgi:hypothetical protein